MTPHPVIVVLKLVKLQKSKSRKPVSSDSKWRWSSACWRSSFPDLLIQPGPMGTAVDQQETKTLKLRRAFLSPIAAVRREFRPNDPPPKSSQRSKAIIAAARQLLNFFPHCRVLRD